MRLALSLLAAALCTIPAVAQAGNWVLGSEVAMVATYGNTAGSEATSAFAVPGSPLLYGPSITLGYMTTGRRHELAIEWGALLLNETGSLYHLSVVGLGYTLALPRRRLTPTLGARVGIVGEGSSDRSESDRWWGLSLGGRLALRDDHGELNVRVTRDRIDQSKLTGRPTLDATGLRLGFAVWF